MIDRSIYVSILDGIGSILFNTFTSVSIYNTLDIYAIGAYMPNMKNVSIAAREADSARRVNNLNIFSAVEAASSKYEVSPRLIYRELEKIWPERYGNMFDWRF